MTTKPSHTGLRGLYKGLGPDMAKIAPAAAISWTVFERGAPPRMAAAACRALQTHLNGPVCLGIFWRQSRVCKASPPCTPSRTAGGPCLLCLWKPSLSERIHGKLSGP